MSLRPSTRNYFTLFSPPLLSLAESGTATIKAATPSPTSPHPPTPQLKPVPAAVLPSSVTAAPHQQNPTTAAAPSPHHHFPNAPRAPATNQTHQPHAAAPPRRRANNHHHKLSDLQVYEKLRAIVSPGNPSDKYCVVEKIGQG